MVSGPWHLSASLFLGSWRGQYPWEAPCPATAVVGVAAARVLEPCSPSTPAAPVCSPAKPGFGSCLPDICHSVPAAGPPLGPHSRFFCVVLQGPFSAALSCAVCSHPTSVLICPESARLAIQGTGLMTISRASTLGVLNNSTLRLRGKAAPQPHPLPNFLNPYMAFQSGPSSALLLKRAPPFPLSSRCDHHAFPMEDHPLPSPQEHLGPAWGVTLQPGA